MYTWYNEHVMARCWVYLLLTLTILHGVWPDFQPEHFISMKNAKLLGHSVSSTSAESDVTCIRHCLRHQDVCVAVNYCPLSLECQLCSETPDKNGTVAETNLAWNLHYHKGPCDTPWTYYGTSCYLLEPSTMPWLAGVDHCSNIAAQLITINDPAENQFLYTVATNAGVARVWLGLNDRASEGTFVWQSGAPMNYSNFAPSEGYNNNEDCMFMAVGAGKWGDKQCGALVAVMCEKSLL